MTKPTYQAASTRVAAPVEEVGAAPVDEPLGLRGVMMSEVNEDDEDVLVKVEVPLRVLVPVPVLVPFVAVAGRLLVVLVPAAVDECVLRGTVEDVGLLEIGKLDELA